MRGFRRFGEPLPTFGKPQSVLNIQSAMIAAAPYLWYSMRATGGATEVNRGSGGSAFDASINGGVALAQVGKLGANEAHDVDGTTGYYQVTTGAGLQGGQFWWAFLVNPDTAGESNAGRFFTYGTTGQQYLRINAASMVLQAVVTGTGNAVATTSTPLDIGQWSWVFEAFDDSAAILGDRKAHIYIGKNGAVSEAAYSSNSAMTGTFTPPSVGNLFLANGSAGAAVTLDGKMDEVMAKYSFPATLAALVAQWTAIVRASGV